jgi:short-subunit dehydrogenase
MNRLDGKIAIVTGSSAGIGREAAIQLAEAGVSVMLNGRNENRLKSVIERIRKTGGKAAYYCGDISQLQTSEEMIRKTIEKWGRIDILVNNAGVSSRGFFDETDPQVFVRVTDINLLGSIFPSLKALPYLKKSKGSLIFVSSLAGLRGMPYTSIYSITKMGQKALAESLQAELFGSGVHTGICYVGITENDPQKTVIGADGTNIPLTGRKNRWARQQQVVSAKIIQMIRHRSALGFTSLEGRLFYFLSRFFPGLFGFMLKRSAGRVIRMNG